MQVLQSVVHCREALHESKIDFAFSFLLAKLLVASPVLLLALAYNQK
jgi:hypothetical protein